MDEPAIELQSGGIDDIGSKTTEEKDTPKEKDAENSVPIEGNSDNLNQLNVDDVEDEQKSIGRVVSDDHQVRRCTRTGVLINLENARKKARKAGMAVKMSIRRLDDMLREQWTILNVFMKKLWSCYYRLLMTMTFEMKIKRFQ